MGILILSKGYIGLCFGCMHCGLNGYGWINYGCMSKHHGIQGYGFMGWLVCGFMGVWQGIVKGKVSMYCWPLVWLFWNQLYDNWQFLFLFAKQTISHTGWQWCSDTSLFSILWLWSYRLSGIMTGTVGCMHMSVRTVGVWTTGIWAMGIPSMGAWAV